MQQAVRESVAAVFESMMSSEENAHVISNIHVMRTVLQAGGSTVKDVADWIRAEPVVRGGVRQVLRPSTTTTPWKPAPKAPLPSSCLDEEEACNLGTAYVHGLESRHASAFTSKEKDFFISLTERFEDRRQWLTEKQLAWLNLIAGRVGHPKLM